MMFGFKSYIKSAIKNNKSHNILVLISILIFELPLSSFASWYTGGAILLHPIPYHTINSNYIKLGSSKLNVIANGIAINGGYKLSINKYMLATEFDIGGFSDADGNITYQDVEHYVSASYYMAIKQKLGFHITSNFVGYGLFGLSENSIGDRVYSTAQYFNRKQISFLYGGGLEYYTKRDSKVGVYAEFIYFTPTNMSFYSGGAETPVGYSLTTYGLIPQFGMRYYFD